MIQKIKIQEGFMTEFERDERLRDKINEIIDELELISQQIKNDKS